MVNRDFIRYCYGKAIRHKRNRWDIRGLNDDECIESIYTMLRDRTYKPAIPYKKTIHDKSSNKERLISVVPFFPDGVIQQCIVESMIQVLQRNMYPWSCASLPGRGIKRASLRTRRLLKNKSKTKYCMKLDVHHFYPSIDHDKLYEKLEHRIKDREFLDLIKSIIDTSDEGLPIGFYLSQWLSNFYLEDLDWYMHSLDGVYGYVRYMDDMVILGPNKRKLHKNLKAINEFINTNGLVIKGNYQIFPVDSRGIDFVGYRFYHTHVALRRKNFLRFTRTCRKIIKAQSCNKRVSYVRAAGFISRLSQLKHCNSGYITHKYIKDINIKQIKEVIRMKVNGSIKPDSFIIESDPSDNTMSRAVFRENIAEKQNDNGETVYDYDEYVLDIKSETGLAAKVTANYDFYLLAAKGRDSWQQMNAMLENKIE